MQTKRIEGVAIFSENGSFSFDSGLPEAEPVLEEGMVCTHQGTFKVAKNASATFTPAPARTFTPPSLEDVLRDENLIVKRTTRNFLVVMKFPIFETDEDTVAYHKSMWNKTRKAINASREEIKKSF